MLTPRKKQILDFINTYTKKHAFSPSLEEMKKELKLRSVSNIHQHIEELRKGGYLRKEKNQHRSVEVQGFEKMVSIPLLGTIAAGQPIETIPNKATIAVPANKLPRSGNVYALRVSGNSMVDEKINDGDLVLIKHQNTAENGDRVVALLNGNEATLKTFHKESGRIELRPANKNYRPIVVQRGEELSIQGVLLDVIKTMEPEQPARPFILPAKKNATQRGTLSDYLNKVYNGDIMHVLKDLPDNSVDMVFGDPDYNVGIKYENNNYTRDFDDYINWYIELTRESARVLKNEGNLFMMNYPKQNAHLRVKYLDKYFTHVQEYVWVYNTNVGHTPRRFTTAHRSILHIRKSAENKFFKGAVALPYKNPTDKRIIQNLANGSSGRMPYSWFEFNLVKNVSKEKTRHACQIPQKLTEMLVKASTNPNDVVLVLFGGSGAEIDVCRNLNRQFISAELNKNYCDIINSRLDKGFITPEHKLTRGRRLAMPINTRV